MKYKLPRISLLDLVWLCIIWSSLCFKKTAAHDHATINFFTFSNGEGYSYADNYTPGCHEMPPYFRKNTWSVNLNGKYAAFYDGKGCMGDGVNIPPDYRQARKDLRYITVGKQNQNWGDRISSWKPITKEEFDKNS